MLRAGGGSENGGGGGQSVIFDKTGPAFSLVEMFPPCLRKVVKEGLACQLPSS